MSTIQATQQNVQTRIMGTYVQQVWIRDNAEEVERIAFDATLHVLCMDYDDLIAVQDGDETSDEIGNEHVEWEGPHSVFIVDSICAFFGVYSLSAITPAMHDAAWEARGMNALALMDPEDIIRAWLVKRWEERDLSKWVFEEVNTRIYNRLGDGHDDASEQIEDEVWADVQDSEEICQAKRDTRDEASRLFLQHLPNITGDLIDAIAELRDEDVVNLALVKGYSGTLRLSGIPSTLEELEAMVHG